MLATKPECAEQEHLCPFEIEWVRMNTGRADLRSLSLPGQVYIRRPNIVSICPELYPPGAQHACISIGGLGSEICN